MKIILSNLQEKDYEKWDEFVKSNQNSTIFHTIAWKRIIEETFNYQSNYLVLKNLQGEILAVSPAFLVKKVLGKAIISQPFFEYGGIIVKEGAEEGYKSILDFYKKKVGEENLKYIEIKTIPENDNDKYFEMSGFLKQLKAFYFSIYI